MNKDELRDGTIVISDFVKHCKGVEVSVKQEYKKETEETIEGVWVTVKIKKVKK